MTRAALLACGSALALGCAGSRVELHFGLEEGLFGAKGYRLNSVVLEPGFYGRGCVDLVVERDGDVRLTMQQDGTSDWIVGRAAPGLLREAVTAALGVVSGPVDAIKGLLGLPPAQPEPPSEIHGCQGVLED